MEVKSLSQMMKPGAVNGGGDCDTCGPSGNTPTVTRVATANLAKLAKSIPKADAQPIAAVSPIMRTAKPELIEASEEEKPKSKGGRPPKAQPKEEENENEAND